MTQLDAGAGRRRPGPRGISRAQVEAALRTNAGVYSLAAKQLGVSRQAVFDRVQRSGHLRKIIEEIQETLLDAVDAGLADLIINKRDPATLRWYADRKGHGRGYGGGRSEGEPCLESTVTIHIQYVDGLPEPDALQLGTSR